MSVSGGRKAGVSSKTQVMARADSQHDHLPRRVRLTPEDLGAAGGRELTVGCVSDTHVPGRARALPEELLERLGEVDLILHAGDITVGRVLDDLRALAPVLAVAGNVDPPDVGGELERAVVAKIGPWTVGLTHGDLGRGGTTVERALGMFTGADVVVFGHSHQPLCESRDGVLLLNPGSPTDPRWAPWPSYGLLYLPGRAGGGAVPRAEVRRLRACRV